MLTICHEGRHPGTNPGPEPGPEPDILQLSVQAQHTLKSTCITGILETEAAYLVESVMRFIDATYDLVFQEAFIAL